MTRLRRREALGLAAAALGSTAGDALGIPTPAPDAELTRIAFGSCGHQDRPQPIWDGVLRWAPELFLFLGDNVYGDSETPGVPELIDAYRVAGRPERLGRVRESVPVMATWDDHDYGLNDAGADYALKAQSQAAFATFWDLPADDPRRTRPGVYSAESFGPDGRRVQVVLLDTRSFRSPLRKGNEPERRGYGSYVADDDPTTTMLGEEQWRWLEERLAEPADLRVVGSSIQVLATVQRFERWANLPRERERLLGLLRASPGRSVLLSGDRHFGAIYVAEDGLTEITSSGLNMVWREPTDREKLLRQGPFAAENFGTLTIDWSARRVEAAIRGLDGKVALGTAIALDG